jgi:hypothetical protein
MRVQPVNSDLHALDEENLGPFGVSEEMLDDIDTESMELAEASDLGLMDDPSVKDRMIEEGSEK